ncbi:MAG TPA: ATP-grasp domain-containing protein [Beutenbergiaceae bacterium]|nr:ATP-grasp domain-containing protein [Beutenbergiaceae bacterium]
MATLQPQSVRSPVTNRPMNVFVVGLDDHNRDVLESAAHADQYRFHGVLTYEEIYSEEISFTEILTKATMVIDAFDGPVDAIIGFWDFPISCIVPLLRQRYGLPSHDLTDVVKCEHKYWSRLIQQEVITEIPKFGLVDPFTDTTPPAGMSFPMWIKPVKSFASMLAIKARNQDEFDQALNKIRNGITRLGDPFNAVLEHVELPPHIADVGGHMCIAEEAITGQQVTVEGFRQGSRVVLYGLIDSIHYDDAPSFLRYQYPSALPAHVQQRMREISKKVVQAIGLDGMTFNIEYFWDPHHDEIKLLEINPRHSQSHAELFTHVDGMSNHQIMLELALGNAPQLPQGKGEARVAATWFLRHFTDGIVTRHPTDEEIAAIEREIPGVYIEVTAHRGELLSVMHGQDSYSYRLATVFIGAEDVAELVAKYDDVVARLHFDIAEVPVVQGRDTGIPQLGVGGDNDPTDPHPFHGMLDAS